MIQSKPPANPPAAGPFDAIVIGAGINGLYSLYRLRELGMSVRLLEAGSGIGGTWYWNRYPGARLDSESWSYGYFFSDDIQERWDWSENFAGQPELERYFNFVADELDLRRDIELDCRVGAARFDDEVNLWTVTTERGQEVSGTYLVSAVGLLSAPQFPPFDGLDDFSGVCHHTALWPAEAVDFANKRVVVVGTGASGVQVIASVAREVAQLTVFQRTPNWCTPINNAPISAAESQALKARRQEIYDACQRSPGGFIHTPRDESALDVSAAERRRFYEELWAAPGLSMYQGNFRDLLLSWEVNNTLTDFISEKVRERVTDPAVADKLIPKDHGFAMKRPPLETNYYEAYNLDNVELVNLDDEPVLRVTATGLQTSKRFLEVDVLVIATGFDAVTGSILRMDLQGSKGLELKDHWSDGPSSSLGMQTAGFPNLFIVGGPHGPAGNNPRSAEHQVDWIARAIRFMRERGATRMETTLEAEEIWTAHAASTVEHTLQAQGQSWYFGSNVPGKKRAFLLYAGGQLNYRARMAEVEHEGYPGFLFDGVAINTAPGALAGRHPIESDSASASDTDDSEVHPESLV